MAEYKVMSIFVLAFSVVIFLVVDFFGRDKTFEFYATIAFVLGSITSMFCGYVGMKIAVAANFRTAFKAISSL